MIHHVKSIGFSNTLMIFCPPLGTSIIPSQRYFDDDVPIPVWWDMWWFPGGYWCSMNLLEVLKVLAVSLRDLGGMSLSSNKLITLPQTNSSHLKIGHRKRKLVLQPSICRGYVSFRECRRVFSVRFGGRGFLKPMDHWMAWKAGLWTQVHL